MFLDNPLKTEKTKEKELEEKLANAERRAKINEEFYNSSRKWNYRLGWITVGALALASITSSCPRTVTQETYRPFYIYDQTKITEIEKPGKYTIHSDHGGIYVFPHNEKSKNPKE